MSRTRANCHSKLQGRAQTGALPSDLYAYAEAKPLPRIGRPPKHDPETWAVTDDWPESVLVSEAEVDVLEAWFGDLFDDLFGPDCGLAVGEDLVVIAWNVSVTPTGRKVFLSTSSFMNHRP
ncbi:hypothetical protein ACVCNR_18445 (plasmid) [Aquamicrobium terrae]